jgi:outer membrane protein assembly factor BamB
MRPTLVAVTLMLSAVYISADDVAERNWPQWRGPHATGVAPHAKPPVEWSESRNVRWKVEIPGRGTSTPIVWGDLLFVTTAIPSGKSDKSSHEPRGGAMPREPHRFVLMAIDRDTGKVRWEKVVREEVPHETTQENGTWASSSAVTDGELVIASFESRGIYAFDRKGTPVWQVDLGDKKMRNEFGEGSTPALHGNYLVVVWDHTAGSFVVTLDKRTGKELWRQPREEIDTWATPLVVEHGGRRQVVVSGMNRLRSYDLETGRLVWQTAGVTMNPIPSPVSADGMVFVTSGFRGNSLKAIRLADASGELSGPPAIAWTLDRDTPYVPSPLLYDGIIYILKSNNGLLSAFDARTGTPHYQVQRLEKASNVYASPVGAAGRVYIAGRDGTTVVLRHGKAFEVMAENTLDDGFDASPAIAGNDIFLRGYKSLYRLSEGPTGRSGDPEFNAKTPRR